MKRLLKYPVMTLFFAFLFILAAVNLLIPAKAYSELENRYLSQRPSLSISKLLDSGKNGFAQQFESYVNDQFVARNGWITLKSICETVLGKTENNGVVYGEDGHLFEKLQSVDEARYARNAGLLERFAQQYPELSKRVMIVPSAYEILTDKTPAHLENLDQLSRIDALYERLDAAGMPGIDAASALAAHRDEEIYYRTDHHWTTYGAYLGYSAYLEDINITPVPLDGLTANEQEGFYGTHYSKAKRSSIEPDVLRWYDLPIDSILIDQQPAQGMYDLTMLEERDKYAMFLHGNPGVVTIENADAPGRTLLVIKDSYANCMTPFLTRNFSRVVVVDLRSLPQPLSELIEREEPSEVLILYSFSNLAGDANLPAILY